MILDSGLLFWATRYNHATIAVLCAIWGFFGKISAKLQFVL